MCISALPLGYVIAQPFERLDRGRVHPAPSSHRARSGSIDTSPSPASSPALLEPTDPVPAIAENPGAASPFLLVCDHAGRALPRRLGRLGLPDEAFETHIAWDIGALELSRRLAEGLDACLIHQTYSRLAIDCNRAPDDADSIVTAGDGWTVAGNHNLSAVEAEGRRAAIFAPYHARIGAEIDERQARGAETVLVCVHSFTPSLGGVRRPWHVGVLHLGDSPASTAMLALLRQEPDLVVGDNQPYAMDGVDFTAPFHAHRRGLDAVELEVRQDLLGDPAGVRRMAALFVRLLPLAIGGR
jgi:predicted N-formylglutamate amidohydrolase